MQFVSLILKFSTGLIKKPWKLIIFVYFLICSLTLVSRFLILRGEIAGEINLAFIHYKGCQESEKLTGFPACNKAKLDSQRWAIFSAMESLVIELPELFKNELNPLFFVISNYPVMITLAFIIVKSLIDAYLSRFMAYRKRTEAERLQRYIMDKERYTLGYGPPLGNDDIVKKRKFLEEDKDPHFADNF